MKGLTKNLKRREFLEWITVAGISSATGLGFNSPMGKERVVKGIPAGEEQDLRVRPADKTTFHVFSKHLQFFDYKTMAEVTAEIGFDGVDLTVRPEGHVLPERVEEELPKAVSAIRNQGLQASTMTTSLTNATNEINRKILRTASKLGINYYRSGWLWYDDQISISKNLANFKKILRELGSLNEEFNIVGGYQNHAGFSGHPLGGPIWDLAEVLNEIANPYMGCQYDIRHATVEGGTTWPLGLRRILPHVNTLVVKDFKWGKVAGEWRIINTPIGEGMVDFPKFFALLQRHNISAPISVHFEYEMPEHQQNLSIKEVRQQTIHLMQKDLNRLKKYKKDAGLE